MQVSADTNPVTLTRWILQQQQQHQGATGDFTLIMQSMALACKYIANAVRKAGIAKLYGLAGEQNVQGEDQKKLDVLSNEIMVNALRFCTKVGIMVSEEIDNEIIVDAPNAKYAVSFDPLDGSSNIDCNVSVGSIFGIWRRVTTEGPMTVADLMQPGTALVAAGYCMYGSATQMVLSVGSGVNVFTLDPALGEFCLSQSDVKIKPHHTIYSCNEGNSVFWDDAIKTYIAKCKEGPKPFSARYVGSMVADVHRTILYGGVFMYPKDTKSPKGKLRVLYEVYPMSFIVEQAGGQATDGYVRSLEKPAEGIHDRAPAILGSSENVEAIKKLYAELKC